MRQRSDVLTRHGDSEPETGPARRHTDNFAIERASVASGARLVTTAAALARSELLLLSSQDLEPRLSW